MFTRSNNPANNCRIVVQQRTHENNLDKISKLDRINTINGV